MSVQTESAPSCIGDWLTGSTQNIESKGLLNMTTL